MHTVLARFLALLAPLSLAVEARAQIHLGQVAPEFALETWLNVPEGEAPTKAGLHGRVVMIEFWGTWCAPCLRSMPHVQELCEIYAEDGLAVIAIANETPEPIRPYLEKVELTMPIGCDPEQRVHQAYGVGSWPTTVLIDRAGALRYYGSPWEVEPKLLELLGLLNDEGAMLDRLLATIAAGDAAGERLALRRLTHALPRAFDVSAWARERAGDAQPVAEMAELASAELLTSCAAAAPDEAARRALFATLAARGDATFDLLAWSRARAAADFPLDQPEVAELLLGGRNEVLLDALTWRAPTEAARAAACANPAFVTWCLAASRAVREEAKRGLMLERYSFAGVEPRDTQRYWADLGLAGLRPDPSGRRAPGIPFGREHVAPETIDSYVDDALRRCVVAQSYASARGPSPDSLAPLAEKERARILRALEGRFDPAPGGG